MSYLEGQNPNHFLNSKLKNTIYLLTGSLVFLALPWFLSMRPPEESPLSFTIPLLRDMITNALLILFFMLNYYLLIPRLYFNKRYVEYGGCIVIAFLGMCLIPTLTTGGIPWKPPPGLPEGFGPPPGRRPGAAGAGGLFDFIQQIRHSIYLFMTVMLFSVLLRVRARLFLVEKDKINAELSFLRAQINPHFLFNTLNSVYALSVKKDERTSDAVINLAGLMRYMIKDAGSDKIPLQKEFDYLTSYIELQKTRLRDTTAIQFTKEGQVDGLEIPPLLLITFVENAFKYGVNPDEESAILVALRVQDTELTLEVSNKKVLTSQPDSSMGIGLKNTRHRLDLLYPNRYRLYIKEDEKSYTIHLSMLLT